MDIKKTTLIYNGEEMQPISFGVEKGFFSTDLVLSKKIKDKMLLKLVGRNLLNPDIEQTQKVRNINTGNTSKELVRAYKKGSQFTLSLKYSF